jgi:hypothetical protein
MRYTVEQLKEMPVQILRGLNIETREEEELVQSILNTRMADMPLVNPMNFTSGATDQLTPEKEAELQAKIDARNATLKAQFVPMSSEEVAPVEVVPDMVTEPAPLEVAPETVEVIPEPVVAPEVTPEPVEVTPEPVEVIPEARFCEFCDSKGVRHKKECSLYVPTRGPGSVNGY